MFIGKSVLFLGPSKSALEGFEYSVISSYDFIARTNKYLETKEYQLDNNKNRCDILFLNSNCVRFYSDSSNSREIFGKKIFVKLDSEKRFLLSKYNNLQIESLQHYWNKNCAKFYPHKPYYGTVAIDYLRNNCSKLDIAGIDFYDNGFSRKDIYVDGYYDLEETSKQESQHSIDKDLMFTKDMLRENKNINLLHTTKDIFVRKIRELDCDEK